VHNNHLLVPSELSHRQVLLARSRQLVRSARNHQLEPLELSSQLEPLDLSNQPLVPSVLSRRRVLSVLSQQIPVVPLPLQLPAQVLSVLREVSVYSASLRQVGACSANKLTLLRPSARSLPQARSGLNHPPVPSAPSSPQLAVGYLGHLLEERRRARLALGRRSSQRVGLVRLLAGSASALRRLARGRPRLARSRRARPPCRLASGPQVARRLLAQALRPPPPPPQEGSGPLAEAVSLGPRLRR